MLILTDFLLPHDLDSLVVFDSYLIIDIYFSSSKIDVKLKNENFANINIGNKYINIKRITTFDYTTFADVFRYQV